MNAVAIVALIVLGVLALALVIKGSQSMSSDSGELEIGGVKIKAKSALVAGIFGIVAVVGLAAAAAIGGGDDDEPSPTIDKNNPLQAPIGGKDESSEPPPSNVGCVDSTLGEAPPVPASDALPPALPDTTAAC